MTTAASTMPIARRTSLSSVGSEIFHDALSEPPRSASGEGREGGRPPGSTSRRQAHLLKSFRVAAGGRAERARVRESFRIATGKNANRSDEAEGLEDIGRFRAKCGEIVDDERVQHVVLMLIAINSAMIGAATFPEIAEAPRIARAFEAADLIVLAIFTIESAMQCAYHGVERFLRDGWLVFDLLIVAMSWISVEVDGLKAVQILRALRFVTQVAILRNVVVALLSIVPSIAAIFTLLLLICYIFAVMFTTLFKDLYDEGHTGADYFGRMDLTLFTLFQFLCLDEWSGIAYEVMTVYYWAWAIFVVFIVMSAFVVINLMIAVICDALKILRTAEKTMLEQNLYGLELEEEEQLPHEGASDPGGVSELRRRVAAMQKIMDEMVATQERMARTIQHLVAEKRATDTDDDEVSNGGSRGSNENSDASHREGVEICSVGLF